LSTPLKKIKKTKLLPKPNTRKTTTATYSYPSNGSAHSLENCDTAITPACIKALYQIPDPTSATPNNSLGLYEVGDTYAQEDLDLFFAKFAPSIPKGTHPIPAFIDGATAPVPISQSGVESDIDMTMALSLIYPQTLTLYQSDVSKYPGTFNTFLDALDGVSITKRTCSLL
jgi:tripeptidyl-peptidase-1